MYSFFLGGVEVGSPYIMYLHLHINSKKWTFYSVKSLKCESSLSLCVEILISRYICCIKYFKCRPFLIA